MFTDYIILSMGGKSVSQHYYFSTAGAIYMVFQPMLGHLEVWVITKYSQYIHHICFV